MCGISGIINLSGENVNSDLIKLMMRKMKHRGPDDEGLSIHDNVGLGFVRLSILDLSEAGHQPMKSFDERYVIVFNGEVYNYLEIRNELQHKFTFKSNTDTEVILNAYIEWGEACLNKFNGMFSFAIYDTLKKEVFCARDRFGIKPFYYYSNGSSFVFASDTPSILALPFTDNTPNDEVIFTYLLSNRSNFSEDTFFKKIKKLKPGHKLTIRGDKYVISQWYSIEEHRTKNGFDNASSYLALFKDSIKMQLRSDVPVGICLSGGLDSSAIASAMLDNNSNSKLHSFSAIYNKGDTGDEQEFIDIFKGQGINMHYTHPTLDSLIIDLPRFVEAFSEPIPGTSVYAEFKVMELAKKNVTVLLNGQGADEVMGGYDYFYGAYLKDCFCNFNWIYFIKACFALLSHKKFLYSFKYFLFFMSPGYIQSKALRKRNDVFTDKFYNEHINFAQNILDKFYNFKTINAFYKNHLTYKFEHQLLWADKAGMFFSLETRFPFLDHRLVESTLSTKNTLVLYKGWTKYILREAIKGLVNDKIRLRKDKVGFATPESKWFRDPKFQSFINEIIESDSFKSRKYFDATKVKQIFVEHLKGKKDHGNIIWKTIHLELWLRSFVDEKVRDQPQFKNLTSINLKGQVCKLGVWDETIPGISFDSDGFSNYSRIFNKLIIDYPRGEKGKNDWSVIVNKIKKDSKNKKYDCIIGLSGGTDSSYLLHQAKMEGLKPLAVYLDNGWSSNISLKNIEKLTKRLNIDLYTYVIDYSEVMDVLKSFIRAQLPWADAPTDHAIKSILYKIANKYGLKYVLVGHDFRSEGFQPDEWTYCDSKQLKYIVKKYSGRNLMSFPTVSIWKFIYYSYFKGIKVVKPYFYLEYKKSTAKEFLTREYGWEDYGGHHYENTFTKFIITYWLFEKFNIDKRKITFSGQILSGDMRREDAIKHLSKKPYDVSTIDDDQLYVLKKLQMDKKEFSDLLKGGNKSFHDYPSYYPLFSRFKKVIFYLIKYLLPNKPLMFYQMEERGKKQ